MELAESGTFQDVLREFRRTNIKLNEEVVKDLFIQLTAGLKYLHDHRIIDGDLHSNNILVFKDDSNGNWILKFANFGLAKEFSSKSRSIQDVFYLEMVFDIANSTEFVTPNFQEEVKKLIHRIHYQWYESIESVISNYHSLYPQYRSDPCLWVSRPRTCTIM